MFPVLILNIEYVEVFLKTDNQVAAVESILVDRKLHLTRSTRRPQSLELVQKRYPSSLQRIAASLRCSPEFLHVWWSCRVILPTTACERVIFTENLDGFSGWDSCVAAQSFVQGCC